MKCYKEEVELVIEEMRQTLVSFDWTARKWEQRAVSPSLSALEATTAIGVAAYAYKQANLHRQLIPLFLSDWYGILEKHPLAAYWINDFPRPPPKSRRNRLACNIRLFHSASSTQHVDADGVDRIGSSDNEAGSPDDNVI